MRRREILQNLPEFTRALGEITNIDPQESNPEQVVIFKKPPHNRIGRYVDFGHRYTEKAPTPKNKSDLDQLTSLRRFSTLDFYDDFQQAKLDHLRRSLVAMNRLSQSSEKSQDVETEKYIVRETKYIAKKVAHDALLKEDYLSDEQKQAIQKLSPILPLGQRLHAKFLK